MKIYGEDQEAREKENQHETTNNVHVAVCLDFGKVHERDEHRREVARRARHQHLLTKIHRNPNRHLSLVHTVAKCVFDSPFPSSSHC